MYICQFCRERARPERDPHVLFTINSDENQELREEIKMLRQTIKDINEQKKSSNQEQENIPQNRSDQHLIESLKKQIALLRDEKAGLYLENENLKSQQKEYEINIIRNRKIKMERKLKFTEIEMRKNIEG